MEKDRKKKDLGHTDCYQDNQENHMFLQIVSVKIQRVVTNTKGEREYRRPESRGTTGFNRFLILNTQSG